MLPVFLITRFCCKTSSFHVNIGGPHALLSLLFFCFRALLSPRFIFCVEVLFSRVADLLRVVIYESLVRCIFFF